MEDDGVRARIRSGYLPLVERLQEPVPSAYNRVEAVPPHVKECQEAFNEAATAYNDKLVQSVTADLVAFGGV
jgi:hypothetical protein